MSAESGLRSAVISKEGSAEIRMYSAHIAIGALGNSPRSPSRAEPLSAIATSNLRSHSASLFVFSQVLGLLN